MSASLARPASLQSTVLCAHCGLPTAGGRFCCAGCDAAHGLIQTLGLGTYYTRRILARDHSTLRPDPFNDAAHISVARHVQTAPDGTHSIVLAVEGLSCGACVWLIEQVLAAEAGVKTARVNLTTRRLTITFTGDATRADQLAARVASLGYRVAPFDAARLALADDAHGRALTRALAVAGFAAANVMLLSLGTWFGLTQHMGPATRDLLHWVSALIALPAVAYSGQPFFRSAFAALRHGRSNMDVPISIGVIIVSCMSLAETIAGGVHTYFDSAVTLLFFLLIGRVLDHRARGAARATAAQLLMLRASDVRVQAADGTVHRVASETIVPGDIVLVAMGERIGADGIILTGDTTLDSSVISGESLPQPAAPGAQVFAGMLNLGAAITVRANATAADTLLAECQRLIDAAQTARGRFVALADRIARAYAPAVHLTALTTFMVWYFVAGRDFAWCLRTAVSVLIITCPCALALAVPAVQVIATSRLMRLGVLLKSPTALERLAQVDTVVFDKTGTLTEPTLHLAPGADAASVKLAASLASTSRHPLCRALCEAAGPVAARAGVTELPAQGILAFTQGGELRLGRAAFCAVIAEPADSPELWLTTPHTPPVRFTFAEALRRDSAKTVATLGARGFGLALISGDHAASVQRIAATLGITTWRARMTPPEKAAYLGELATAGHHALMVGDGLNDAPSLAAAYVSCAPASAADISQTVADVVIQGATLAPLALLLATARRARRAIAQNLVISLLYNLIMVPLAISGAVTPWIAAIAMSGSSLLVMGNAFRGTYRAGGDRR